jgi:hypothetical protein
MAVSEGPLRNSLIRACIVPGPLDQRSGPSIELMYIKG